jgi:hypothetical protein
MNPDKLFDYLEGKLSAAQAGRLFCVSMLGTGRLPRRTGMSRAGCVGADGRATNRSRDSTGIWEPVTLASKEGVLEVRLIARQGQATLDTVTKPVQNFLLFDYEVIRGNASDGKKSGGNLYPAPTLQVFPGEKLIVHFGNGLSGLTIRDFFVPQYTRKGQPVLALPGADDLVPVEPSHARAAHQPEGKCRQRVAAHPSRHVEHLHLRHPQEHAAGNLLVSQPSSRAHGGARLWWARRPARHRTHGSRACSAAPSESSAASFPRRRLGRSVLAAAARELRL